MPGPRPGPDAGPEANRAPDSVETGGPVRPRPNVVSAGGTGFFKRYEAVGYWTLLAIVLALVIWFLVASAVNSGNAGNAEATVIANLFAPETATKAAIGR